MTAPAVERIMMKRKIYEISVTRHGMACVFVCIAVNTQEAVSLVGLVNFGKYPDFKDTSDVCTGVKVIGEAIDAENSRLVASEEP